MPDIAQLNLFKNKIIESIQQNGPTLPVRIASALNIQPLFASAFLSELLAEQKLKTSNLKVGSSPLYYLQGQEEQLEKFIEYLNSKEKEAYFLLKKSSLLEDEKQEPAIRVALRAIKDFAIPAKITFNNETKLYWKHFLLPEEQIKALLQKKDFEYPKSEKQEKEIPKEIKPSQEISSQEIEQERNIEPKAEKEKKQKTQKIYDFPKNIKSYLSSKDIEIIELILEKKKEFIAKVRIDILFGKQVFYLIAKEKKKITENDLTLALQKAQSEKMLALIISNGDLDKKAQPHLKLWQNLIKFEKIHLNTSL